MPDSIENAAGALPVTLRIELIRTIPAGIQPFFVQDLVTQLVGNDREAAAALLDRDDLYELQGAALQDDPSEPWLERALMALDRGWEPRRIVEQTMLGVRSWFGEESLHWQGKVDAFEQLRGPASTNDARRERIIAAGVGLYTVLRDRASVGERRERIFGYPG